MMKFSEGYPLFLFFIFSSAADVSVCVCVAINKNNNCQSNYRLGESIASFCSLFSVSFDRAVGAMLLNGFDQFGLFFSIFSSSSRIRLQSYFFVAFANVCESRREWLCLSSATLLCCAGIE